MTPQDRVVTARKELQRAQEELVEILKRNKSRARAPAVRLLHEVRSMLSPAYPYASQAGQDQIIDRVMKGKREGTFVDVGAYDGVTGSNTLFLEKWRGWTGVLVEPVEGPRKMAERTRTAPCLPVAVSKTAGTADFMAVTKGYTQMSGLLDTYDPTLLKKVRADKRHSEQKISVTTKTLSDILTEAGLENPDFISLDIEGGEISVLEDFDFERHQVGAWAIENNSGTAGLNTLMRNKGYSLVEFCGPDEVYALTSLVS